MRLEELLAEAAAAARLERFGLAPEHFSEALLASAGRYAPAARDDELRQFVLGLRLEDLALAVACARGIERAWEEFHHAYRQFLVDAAGERDLADQIIAELYERGEIARFRGRSTLKSWLRAIVWQAQVDRHRSESRLTPLDELPVEPSREDRPEQFERRENAAALARTLRAEVERLAASQRLLLAWYYVDNLRLAQIARLKGVHESTVSRELESIRRDLRARVEKRLRGQGFSAERVAECFAHATDAPLDFEQVLARKNSSLERT